MPIDLAGVDLKLGRAEEHLDFLGRERTTLLGRNRDRVVGDLDPQTGDYVVRVDGDMPPYEWAIPVSEFAHALRTALDNLLWQLIEARGGTPVAKVTQFPINEDEADFNGKPRRKGPWPTEADRLTDGIHSPDRTFIEEAQPFQARKNWDFRGPSEEALVKGHPLAMLADLNNIDKHRFIHVAYAAAAMLNVRGAQQAIRLPDGILYLSDRPMDVVPVIWGSARLDINRRASDIPFLVHAASGGLITPLNMSGRGDDPTEVAHAVASDVPDTDVRVNPPVQIEISLSDRERPMSIFDFGDIFGEVSRIVEHFRSVVV